MCDCPKGEDWPRPNVMSPFQVEAFPCYAVAKRDRDNWAFGFAAITCRSRDLVEEYLIYGM